jgi:serine/threonine protein phosphatase 1
MRELVLGDCHGGYKGLKQVLERSSFNYKKDKLIFLGDICDGWSETVETLEELLKIKNLVFVTGNHDYWLLDWLEYGRTPIIWTEQGGKATIKSYLKNDHNLWIKHREFLRKKTLYYYMEE